MTRHGPDARLVDPANAGICFVDGRERAAMVEAAAARDFVVVAVDLEKLGDKAGLLEALSAAFDFPPTFGHNWDALADSLGDLSWLPAPGYLLLLDHPEGLRKQAPQDFETLLEILDETMRSHARARVPFRVVLPAPCHPA